MVTTDMKDLVLVVVVVAADTGFREGFSQEMRTTRYLDVQAVTRCLLSYANLLYCVNYAII
jgi:hypothetical protein